MSMSGLYCSTCLISIIEWMLDMCVVFSSSLISSESESESVLTCLIWSEDLLDIEWEWEWECLTCLISIIELLVRVFLYPVRVRVFAVWYRSLNEWICCCLCEFRECFTCWYRLNCLFEFFDIESSQKSCVSFVWWSVEEFPITTRYVTTRREQFTSLITAGRNESV